jgi:acetate---CoA ligase (ADP-forming)
MRGLRDFFSPTGVAIVGASDTRHYPRSILENLLRMGYPKERIFPINPRYEHVGGLACYPSLAALPDPVSLAVFTTRRDTIIPLLEEAAQRGVNAAVVLADGYAEEGPDGRRRQEELSRTAESLGIALLGPNTLGYLAPGSGIGVWAGGTLPGQMRRGGVALAFQSSGTLNLMFSLACHRHIGVRAGVSVGNEALLDIADVLEDFAMDPEVTVIAAFLETTERPRRLATALALARRQGKPVVMLKVGRSDRARRNALAHTGRLTSAAGAWDALLDQLGVIQVWDLDELVETAVMFSHRDGISEEGGVGLCTISGGDCSLLSDLADELSVPVPDVTDATRDVLVRVLQKPTLLGNPLDCENLRREDPARFQECIAAFCRDPRLRVVAFRMNLEEEPNDSLRALYRSLIDSAKAANKNAVVLSRAAESLSSAWFQFFEDHGVAFLPSYRTALSSIAHLLTWTSGRGRREWLPAAVPATVSSPGDSGRVCSWKETQEWLRGASIPYVRSFLVRTPEESGGAARALGMPVAAKLVGPFLAHKSDAGAIRLGLATEAEVIDACRAMLGNLNGEARDTVEGFEIQQMIPDGVEMLLGMTRDATVGPVLLIGMGGVFAEMLRDAVLAVPPVSAADALTLIGRLRGATLLHGMRGGAPVAVGALAELVAAFSQAVVRSDDRIVEIDLNPVLVRRDGISIVDALLTVTEVAHREE